MTATKESKWLCPICALRELPYGQGCPLWEKDQCPDAAHAHITGRWYKTERDKTEVPTVGIASISDEK